MYVFFNPNPEGKSVGDCVIRAISKATNKPWEQPFRTASIGLNLDGR